MTLFQLPILLLTLIKNSWAILVDEKGQQVTIKAYWIRHGFSCANALKEQAKQTSGFSSLKGFTFGLYKDPTLTDCALERARELGPIIHEKIRKDNPLWFFGNRPLFVFSSALVRAMETALMNFPDEEVHVIPNIAEKGMSFDNKPSTRDTQMTKLGRLPNANQHLPRLIFDGSRKQEELQQSRDYESYRKRSDFDRFQAHFPLILAELVSGLPEDDQAGLFASNISLPIVIVSHSGFMQSNLKCTAEGDEKGRKPYNNEVWLQHYTWELDEATLIPIACEWNVIDGHDQIDAGSKPLICEATVARCNHKPAALITQNRDACTNQGNPVCAQFNPEERGPVI